MTFRRTGSIIALGAVLAATAACGADEPASTNDELTIAFAGSAISNLPMMAAIATGALERQGFDVDYLPGNGSPESIAALLGGDADIAVPGASAVVASINEGAPVVVMGTMARQLGQVVLNAETAESLAPGVTPASPAENRVAALSGLKISTSSPGSDSYTILERMLEAYGVNPQTDVTISPTDGAAAVAGLRQGTYDAGFWAAGGPENNYADGSGVKWLDLAAGDLPEFGDALSVLWVTSEKVAEGEPEKLKKVAAALDEVAQDLESDPETVLDSVKAEFFPEVDDDIFALVIESALDGVQLDGKLTEDEFNAYLQFIVDGGGDVDGVTYADDVHELAAR